MIESIALRKFAVSYFLVHPTKPLCNLVNRITTTIKNRFFKGEIVFIKDKELTGRIIDTTNRGYIVEIYDDNLENPNKEELTSEHLLRKDSATKNEVLGFILSVTRDTPLGRIVANNIIEELGIFKGQKPLKKIDRIGAIYKPEKAFNLTERKEPWEVDPLLEEKEKELEEIEKKRVQLKGEEILRIPAEKWSSQIGTYLGNRKILSVYAGLYAVYDFLKAREFTLEEFTSALFSKEGSAPLLVEIYSKLLKAISHERRKSGKEGLRDMIQIASNITYSNGTLKELVDQIEKGEKESTGFTRIQWFAGDATGKTWQAYMKSFVHDVVTLYEIKVVTNEFSPGLPKEQNSISVGIDRLLMISFLLETVVLGIRFRGYYDTALTEYKEKEKERQNLIHELRRLRGEILVSESTQETKELIDKTEGLLSTFNRECRPEIIRSKIGKYADITFLYIGGELFYEYKETFYLIDKEHIQEFTSVFNTEKKKDSIFIDTFKKFLRIL